MRKSALWLLFSCIYKLNLTHDEFSKAMLLLELFVFKNYLVLNEYVNVLKVNLASRPNRQLPSVLSKMNEAYFENKIQLQISRQLLEANEFKLLSLMTRHYSSGQYEYISNYLLKTIQENIL